MAVATLISVVLAPAVYKGIDLYSADSILTIIGIIASFFFARFAFRLFKLFRHEGKSIFDNTKFMLSHIFYNKDKENVTIEYNKMLEMWGLTPTTANKAVKLWSICIVIMAVIGVIGAFYGGMYAYIAVPICIMSGIAFGWRVYCLVKKQFVPFGKWITLRGFAPLLILAIMLAISAPDMAYAASDDIPLPSQMEVQKKDDLSANIFSHLFGSAWQATAGTGTGNLINSESLGAYSELILKILGVLNAAAMIFVGISIVYMTAVFAVITAHEGKSLGGSLYNSLWTPIRFTMGMSLTAPVLNGLSLLQVALLFCIGTSINMANSVWDTAGEHIVNHAHTTIIEGAPTHLEQEAKTLIAPMLKSTVIQEALMEYTPKTWPIRLQGWQKTGLGLTILEKYDNKYIYQNVDTGNHRILYTPPNQYQPDEIGGFTFTYPAGKDPKMSQDAYNAKKAISDARGIALITMSEQIRDYACHYITRNYGLNADEYTKAVEQRKKLGYPIGPRAKFFGIDCPATVPLDEIIAGYADSIRSVTQANAAAVITDSGMDSVLAKAIDHDGKNSRFGWVSAGMFSFTMSALQKKYDDILSGDVSFTFASDSAFQKTGFGSRGFAKFDIDPKLKETIENVDKYSEGLFGGSFYIKKSDYSDDGSASTAFKKVAAGFTEWIANKFTAVATGGDVIPGIVTPGGNTGGANGPLAVTLYQFKKHDPLVVLAWMGDNLLDAGLWLVAFDAGFSFFGVDIALLSAAGLALCLIGVIFAYVAPIIPLIFWLTALFGWIFLVVESMVAAPLWAASHCLPEGQGLAGQHARRGYIMALDIVLRPTLLVIGAVSAIAIMQAAGWFFSTLFDSFFVNIGSFLSFGPIAELIFTVIIVSVMFNLTVKIYTKGVTEMPQKIIAWIGGVGASLGEHDSTKSTNVVGAVVNQQGGAAASGMKKAAGNAGGTILGGMKKFGGNILQGNKDKPAK